MRIRGEGCRSRSRGWAVWSARPRMLAVAACALVAACVAGCGTGGGSGSSNGKIDAVAAENEYANVLEQIGGSYVKVTAIESNPNTDPHTYEGEREHRPGCRCCEAADRKRRGLRHLHGQDRVGLARRFAKGDQRPEAAWPAGIDPQLRTLWYPGRARCRSRGQGDRRRPLGAGARARGLLPGQ